jgi:hypothetical protein
VAEGRASSVRYEAAKIVANGAEIGLARGITLVLQQQAIEIRAEELGGALVQLLRPAWDVTLEAEMRGNDSDFNQSIPSFDAALAGLLGQPVSLEIQSLAATGGLSKVIPRAVLEFVRSSSRFTPSEEYTRQVQWRAVVDSQSAMALLES